LPERTDNPVVNGILQDFNDELAKLGPLAAQLDESDLAISWFMFHIKALVAILNTDINQYVAQVAQASEQRTAQSHSEMRSIIIFISAFALLALVITGFAGWYIYRNLGSNLTAISRAMSRLARGEPDVPVPALQRRDELGELARAFNVFARNTASLEHTSSCSKRKAPNWRPPSMPCVTALRCSTARAAWWCGTRSIRCCLASLPRRCNAGSTIRACCVR
jgi:HAMP domain-containing protein